MTKPNCTLKAQSLIDDLGGPTMIRKACSDRGITPPGAGAVKMWRSRDRIPGDWIGTILVLAKVSKLPITQYVDRPENPPDPFA